MFRFRRVVIKVGSSVLTRSDGTLNVERMQTLVHQMAELHKDGVDIILVTSGAVASGRSVLKPEKIINSTTNRQMYAAVGQTKLINYYYEMFLEHGIFCGQILTTKEDFDHRLLYLNLKNCLSAMLEHKVIPIVNENDTVAITELMFTDNDELAGLMSTMMDTEVLIILSVIDGLFTGSLSDPTSSVIRQVEPGTNIFSFVHDHKSSHGTGGMHSKASTARKVAAEGIPVIIANGTRDNIIIDLLKPGADVISTLFLPNSTTNVPDNSSWRESALEAARHLNLISDEQIKLTLLAIADEAVAKTDIILAANSKDVDAMDPTNPMRDRLLLTPTRIADIAKDIRKVASLSSPLAKTLEQRTLPNGLNLSKLSVPFGVIGVIYEARPNVSFDVFSLCFKSGNVCVLKGGTDAYNSNRAIVDLIQDVLDRSKINRNVIHLLPAGRIATADLLNAVGVVDVIIPRGSAGLINYVRDTSRVPVIETGAGVCHTYFDEFGDREKGASIINNAKTRRVSVCNALDCLVIHESRLSDLSYLCENLSESKVVIEADEGSYSFLSGKYPFLEKVNDKSYGTEFLSYRMSIKTVSSIQEAIQFITTHSSKHSEAIISQSRENIAIFTKQIDAACVYSNASTAFTDGAQFGMGAEIGISTQKLHARGPMALMELTSYKWIIEGDGQTRPK